LKGSEVVDAPAASAVMSAPFSGFCTAAGEMIYLRRSRRSRSLG
jgi:hypothetical protein